VRAGLGAALLIAALVHVLTVVVVAAGVLLLVVGPHAIPLDVLAVFLVAVGLFVAPRPQRHRTSSRGRSELPATFALVDQVAAGLGVRAPAAIAVDGRFNASVHRSRGETVLTLGARMWAALDPAERTALLAHELGHARGGDPSRYWVVGTALRSLREWEGLLVGASRIRRRPRREARGAGRHGGFANIAELLVPLVLLPLTLLVSLLAAGANRSVRSRQRRCEFLADRAATEVAGTEAVARKLETLLLADVARVAVSSAQARGERPDVLAVTAAAVAAVPDDERARRLRREELSGSAGDATHPPTYRRVQMVRALVPREPSVQSDPAVMAAVDAELAPAFRSAVSA
jgi:Zn-dependent protease with chaperone function